MQYIVLDLEWNQAVTKEKVIRLPYPIYGEIIQIGAIRLNGALEPEDSFNLMIKPRHYLRMNSKVKRLTGIRTQDLADAPEFPEAIERFRSWCGEDPCLLTWGPDDAAMLLDNFKLFGLDASWLPRCYNLQVIFCSQITGDKRQYSLAGAMELLGIPQENRAHDALNDAVNTAAILQKLDLAQGIAQYTQLLSGKEGDCLRSQRFTGFSDRSSAAGDERIRQVACPYCTRLLEASAWLGRGTSRETGLLTCAEHGDFTLQLRYKRITGGKYIVKSQLFPCTDGDRELFARTSGRAQEL